jgi:hypothetical protein
LFGTQKLKADMPLGFEHKSHKPNRVNFSHPQVIIRSTRARGGSCNLNDIP